MAAAWVYHRGASLHAETMNRVKRQGDQSAYLQYSKDLHANWHGHVPPHVGDRNRMPLYPAYQALFYDPRLTDEEFFVVARARSITLSLALLFFVGLLAAWHLPPLSAVTFTAVVAFGVFVFKAGYVQAELLFYTLLLATVIAACHLLRAATLRRRLALGALVGVLAALTHLSKAAALPLVVILAAVLAGQALAHAAAGLRGSPRRLQQSTVAAGAALALALAFLAVLSPYLATNKRVFGRYFYNVNTTFYVWYDNLGQAMKGTRAHGDRVGWPRMPRRQLPGPLKYWREHSVAEMLARVGGGLRQIGIDLWTGCWIAKYVLLYLLLAIVLAVSRPAVTWRLAAEHAAVVVFVTGYLTVYVLGAAFYAPISGTGTARFVLAHAAPLLFVLSWWFAHPDMTAIRWRVAGLEVRPAHVHLLVLAMLLFDLPFAIWPRLTTTYGGY